MLPKDNPKKEKSKKDSDKKKEEDKLQRRGSLTDNSQSASSNSCSSVDSDEASSSGIPDTKGTMTSSEMDAPETSGLDGHLFRRPIRSDTPVQELARDIGFTSLSNMYPLANTQPHYSDKQSSQRSGASSSAMTAESSSSGNSSARNKRGDASAKISNKKSKKREKKEKKERDARSREKDSQAQTYEKIMEMRNRHEQDRMRREVAQLFRLTEDQPTQELHRQRPMPVYAKPYISNISQPKRISEHDKLQATIGFGIAATGIYDKVPDLTGARGEVSTIYKGSSYSDIVGRRKINWRHEFETHHIREQRQYNRMNVEFDAVMQHRYDLRKFADDSMENKWIRNLLHLVMDGKIKRVWKRILVIQKVLQEHPGDGNPYKTMGKTAILELVMKSLVDLLVEPKEGFNVIMYLMSHTYDRCPEIYKKPCFARHHNDCMLAELILSALPPIPARHVLSLATNTTKRRAVHFASISGTPCQMDLLLKFDVDTNIQDISEQTPVHFAVARNNKLLLRQLMWHGTDMSRFDPSKLCMEETTDNIETCNFLFERLSAMERCMSAWLKAICAGKWRLEMPVSSLHCTRIAPFADSFADCFETGATTAAKCAESRRFRLALRDEAMRHANRNSDSNIMLFVLPVMFTPYDPIMPAQNPHIVRTKLVLENDCFQKPAAIMSHDPTVRFKCGGTVQTRDLPSAFHEKHNGYIYAWTFPKNIDENTEPQVALHIDPSQLSRTVARHSILFIQAFTVTNLYTKQKCD